MNLSISHALLTKWCQHSSVKRCDLRSLSLNMGRTLCKPQPKEYGGSDTTWLLRLVIPLALFLLGPWPLELRYHAVRKLGSHVERSQAGVPAKVLREISADRQRHPCGSICKGFQPQAFDQPNWCQVKQGKSIPAKCCLNCRFMRKINGVIVSTPKFLF